MSDKTTGAAIYAGISFFAWVFTYVSIDASSNEMALLAKQGALTLEGIELSQAQFQRLDRILKINAIGAIALYLGALFDVIGRKS